MSAPPVVIVDMGFLLFYRYHATLRYLRCGGKAATKVDAALFTKHLRAQLRDIADRFPGCGPLIVCSDAPRSTLWRSALFPAYKAKRKAAPPELGELALAFLAVVEERGDLLLEAPKLEADDLAFLAVREARKLSEDAPICVISNDRDYVQLCAHFAGVRLFDAALHPVLPTSGDPSTDFKTKLLVGDKSDNIPGVCTPAVAKRLLVESSSTWPPPSLVDDKLQRLRTNEALMDMRLIPDEFQTYFDDRCAPLLRQHLNFSRMITSCPTPA